MWNWISYRDCRKVSWQWLVTRVAWATGLPNSGKQFHVLNESTMENWIRLHVLSCCLKITSPRISWLPSCGTYVIVVFNSNIVIFPDMWNPCLIGWAIFSMVLSNSSIFLCGVTVFRIPLAALQFYFLRIRILLVQDRLW